MDKKAREILFNTYWSSTGWTRGAPRLSDEDFRYAKALGVMFDPVKPTHDEAISRLRAVVEQLTPRQVADGFLASLSTRRVEWRSALGSYSVARWLPEHAATPGGRQCRICGLSDYEHVQEHDLNVLNFERLKWGGVRHSDPVYAALDLELFLKERPRGPTAEDIDIFRDLVTALGTLPSSVTSAALHKHFPSTLKANKSERDQVIAILGLCGVLGSPDHPGFFERYVPFRERTLPNRHNVDMAYPACWWRGSDGVNAQRLEELFGHAL